MPAANQRTLTDIHPGLRAAAALCALLVWLLGLFGTSAQLHGALHPHAGEQEHACAVTLFRDGGGQPLETVVLVVAPQVFPAGEAVSVGFVPAPAPVVRLPPSCGPPRC